MSRLYEVRFELRDEDGTVRVFEGLAEEVGRDLPRLGLKGLKERIAEAGNPVPPLGPETS